MTGFIYIIRNNINNKLYVGKSTYKNLSYLINRYKKELKYRPTKRLIIRAIKKYGINNFNFKIEIDNICDTNELNILEKFYIKKYKTNNSKLGYNLTIGGDGTNGFVWNKKSKLKLSKKVSDGRYLGSKNPFYGKTHSEETRNKIIESNIRRTGTKTVPCTEEKKERIRKGNLGKIPWNKGIPMKLESRIKLSESQKKRLNGKTAC